MTRTIETRMVPMTAAQAKLWNISDPENYECAITTSSIAEDDERWFKIVYIDVGDGGEPVAMVKPWTPPS